jgi:hypothetical protein
MICQRMTYVDAVEALTNKRLMQLWQLPPSVASVSPTLKTRDIVYPRRSRQLECQGYLVHWGIPNRNRGHQAHYL